MPATAPPAARRTRPLRRLLLGAHPALPRPLDAGAERWAQLPPRVRVVLVLVLILAVAAGASARVRAAEGRWGGEPVRVLVAAEDLAIGGDLERLRPVRLPPDALPARPLSTVPAGAVLAMALPAGAVLTERHVSPSGPAAGLPADLRALPIPVEEAWGVTAGGWVDVWVLDGGGDGAAPAARSRPVLELRGEGGSATALVGLAVGEVTVVTGALGQGRVLLAHAPPPEAPAPSR